MGLPRAPRRNQSCRHPEYSTEKWVPDLSRQIMHLCCFVTVAISKVMHKSCHHSETSDTMKARHKRERERDTQNADQAPGRAGNQRGLPGESDI